MKFRLLAIALFSLVPTASAQTACGLGGVTVTVTPDPAPFGAPITVTLTNNSNVGINLPTSCTFGAVHAGTGCSGPAVLSLACLQVITPIPPGQSSSMIWTQDDDFGNQVPAGKYSFEIRYFDGAFSTALSCCPSVTIDGGTGVPYCFGAVGAGACPCGNNAGASEGCQNSTSAGSSLTGTGLPILGADNVVLTASQCPANVPGLFFSGPGQLAGLPFGDGLRCVEGPILRLGVVPTDGAGAAQTPWTLSVIEGVAAGDVRNYQYWYRDVAGPCSSGFNTSNGFKIQW